MIFCVEDDSGIRDLMIYTLEASGYKARGLNDGKELRAALENETPQLILLDIMLPGDDGIALLQKLRSNEATAAIPVIMASAKGTEYDKVRGLDLGADDYLSKPFGMMEMVSRVRAVLRRSGQKSKTALLKVGGLAINTEGHTVTVWGKRVELTLKEYQLLQKFLERPGTVFTRDQLLSDIW